MTRFLPFASAIALLALALPVQAQTAGSVTLRSAEPAYAQFTTPLDIRQTRSWQQSGGEADWIALLAPTGRLTNRGHSAVAVTAFVRSDRGPAVVLFETTLAPGASADVRALPMQNQAEVGRLMASSAVRVGLLVVDSQVALRPRSPRIDVTLTGFDLPISPAAFPGDAFWPGDTWSTSDAFWPGDTWSADDTRTPNDEIDLQQVRPGVR